MKGEQESTGPRLLIIDSCEHVVEKLEEVLQTSQTYLSTSGGVDEVRHEDPIDLIVVGTPPVPVRRLFLSRLRRFFPIPPILVLRKEAKNLETDEEILRGEFLLTDHRGDSDLSIVHSTRQVLPMPPCEHSQSDKSFELVRDVTRVLAESFPDADLDLEQVADELAVPPSRLSRILNREVHISFRQMLRQVRIEEAKRLLLTSKLSIKEISARVGFSDSHYFSRVFKEATGITPSDYSVSPPELIYT